MFARAAARAVPKTPSMVARRGFQTTRSQMSSPYHYPEGPYTNIPFNPKSKFFGVGFWTYSFVGFFAPFGIAAWQTYKPKV
ncbi:cytochrome-c oxidase chain VIIc [Colletotrichum salicis]|uniref:Cytochrome c oxidase subunit 8, mitochondrial n=2 Tax=Colletotrichum acutatum species complex TaxID=2707335 RepID=A0A135UPV0_9PEZI|nr:cytochrome-c oxidase chain VIIc [Colletotrichum salicis]KXH62418.1 cytochrome-c oxidase chain VIIc [Colletotrichum salicis]